MGAFVTTGRQARAMMLAITAFAGLAACAHAHSQAPGPHSETPSVAAHPGHGHSAEMETLPVEKRVAFMSGHVEAGLALYRAGAPDQAAKHLLHPVSETHQAERAGIDALGFQQELFLTVSKALEEGRPAAEIEPQLAAAEANMALMQNNAGGAPVEVIGFLMDTVVEEYQIGVTDGIITDLGEYQDAFGFTVVALDIVERMDAAEKGVLKSELKALLALWPEGGPLADATPTAAGVVVAHVAKVRSALSAF